ncbi:MAG: DUF695 domain-containing protein [Bacteroidales bacterium]|nr:DUF695 domain-containing protein [Bacteroidales bacterium]
MDRWWTYPAEADNGKTVIVSGRDGVDKFRTGGKYNYRIDVTWRYNALPSGMPEDADARLMEEATDALQSAFAKDKVAVMTGIYTGDGRRDWVFYTKNLKIFSVVFNKALAEIDSMPLEIEAEEDTGWSEYLNMRDMTYIPDED